MDEKTQSWRVGDLGLSQPANKISKNNEIYGVIPYLAPEIFKRDGYSKAVDIYSMSMIMWELTTGCKPFANVEHDHKLIYEITDGKRPKITKDTPECFTDLMKRCWDSDPLKRPFILEICTITGRWSSKEEGVEQFIQAEKARLTLIRSERLGPKSTKKPYSKAVFTSRSFRFNPSH